LKPVVRTDSLPTLQYKEKSEERKGKLHQIKSQELIISNLFAKCPLLMFLDYTNVFIAGGCLTDCVTGSESGGDVDIFIYKNAIDPKSEESKEKEDNFTVEDASERVVSLLKQILELNKKYLQLINCVLKPFRPFGSVSRSSNCVTFSTAKGRKVQIIFRLYNTIAEVLHGFDLGCCSIGFDGKKIWTTSRGFYSLYNMVNVVDFTRQSTTMGKRLRKYMCRGFDLVLPDLDIGKVTVGKKLELPGLDFNVLTVDGKTNTVFVVDPDFVDDEEIESLFDYDPEVKNFAVAQYNLNSLMYAKKEGEIYKFDDNHHFNWSFTNVTNIDEILELPMESIFEDCKNLIGIYKKGYFAKIGLGAKYPIQRYCDQLKIINCVTFRELLDGLSDDKHWFKFITSVFAEQEKWYNEFMEYLSENPNLCNEFFWITENPGAQGLLTSSFQPVFDKKEKWYGDLMKADSEPGKKRPLQIVLPKTMKKQKIGN
jgi:hypothetical protein